MSPDAPDPLPRNAPHDDSSGPPTEPRPTSDSLPSPPGPVAAPWGWALLAGVLAGLLTSLGGEIAWRDIRQAKTPFLTPFPTPEDHARVVGYLVRSHTMSFAQQGALLGAILGLAGGLARRSVRAGLLSALVGFMLGGAFAAGAAYGILPIYYDTFDPQEDPLIYTMLTHGAIWAAAGIAAGLAFGLGLGGRGRWLRGALGGLLGGIAATMLYDLVGALAFPLDKTSDPVAATLVTRLFAQLTVGLLVAAGAALGMAPPKDKTRPGTATS